MIARVRAIIVRLFGFLRRRRLDREFEREVEAHMALHLDDNLDAGMVPREARRQALLALGGMQSTLDGHRDRAHVPWIDTWVIDARQSLRSLSHAPGFSATTVATLAAGIGASTLVFMVINAVLLRPLPLGELDRLVAVSTVGELTALQQEPLTFDDYRDLSRDVPAFSGIVAHRRSPSVLGSGADGRIALGEHVSSNYFDVLGVAPMLGHAFSPDDDDAVVILSHGVWQMRFGRDPRVLGQFLEIGGRPRRIIGVAPEGFTGLFRGIAPAFWIPLSPAAGGDRSIPEWWVHARLRPGASLEEARTQVTALAETLALRYPRSNVGRRFRVERLVDASVHPAVPRSWATAGSAGALLVSLLVLVVAAVNVGHLVLARASSRRRDLAVRLALGASRWRVIRHQVIEALMLAACASGLALLLISWAGRLLSAAPLPIPVTIDLGLTLDWRVVTFAFAIAVVTACGCAAGPAWRTARAPVGDVLSRSSGRTTEDRARWRSVMLALQAATAVLLLIFAGLAWRSLAAAGRVQPGFDVDRSIVASAAPGLAGLDRERSAQYLASAAERVRHLASVRAAGWIQPLPLSLNVRLTRLRMPDHGVVPTRELPLVDTAAVWPGAFEALGIRLLSGRAVDDRDRGGAPVAVLVNASFARRYGANRPLVGQHIDVGFPDPAPAEVIGVVADFQSRTLGDPPRPTVFTSGWQDPMGWQSATLVVSPGVGQPPTAGALTSAIRGGDAAVPVFDVQPLQQRMAGVLLLPRYAAVLFGSLGVLALGLTAVGLCGTLWWWVQQRTREFGVRLALGAGPASLVWLVCGQSLVPVASGALCGLGLAFGTTRGLTAVLYGVSPTDPVTLAGGAAVLVASAGLATVWPAWRASRLKPFMALRHE